MLDNGAPAVQSDRKKHLLMDALVSSIHQKKFAIPRRRLLLSFGAIMCKSEKKVRQRLVPRPGVDGQLED